MGGGLESRCVGRGYGVDGADGAVRRVNFGYLEKNGNSVPSDMLLYSSIFFLFSNYLALS